MLLNTVAPETDLILPLPDGEVWDPQTIHTHYFAASVPEAELGVFVYIRYQPAFPLCQGGVCIFRGLDNLSPLEMDYLDFEITMPWPAIDDRSVTTRNGLRIEFLEPGRLFRVLYESADGRTSLDLLQTAVGPLIERPHNFPGEAQESDPSKQPGGSEQIMHCTGTITLHGESFSVDCFPGRDRSWMQVRAETRDGPGLPPLAWSPVYFDQGLSFGQLSFEALDTEPVWKGLYDLDSETTGHLYAWLYVDGTAREVVSLRRNVLERHPIIPAATRQELSITDATGAVHQFEGQAIALTPAPTWPNHSFVDSLYRWTSDTGQVAYGSYQEIWWDDFAHEMKRRRASR